MAIKKAQYPFSVSVSGQTGVCLLPSTYANAGDIFTGCSIRAVPGIGSSVRLEVQVVRNNATIVQTSKATAKDFGPGETRTANFSMMEGDRIEARLIPSDNMGAVTVSGEVLVNVTIP